MGTWDVGSFDNDTAVDWSYALEKVSNLDYVEAALDDVLRFGPASAVDADAAVCAVAAAEVIARLLGRWGEETPYTETADTWVRAHATRPSRTLVDKAIATLERVARSPSELLELWEESGDLEGWLAALEDLRKRLRG